MATLQQKLGAGRFVITAEVTPPVSFDRGDLLAKAAPLKGLADAVNVTDGAGARSHMSALTAATALVQEGIEPILQLTCRDRNRIALQGDLIGAAALGVRNLLMLRGDDPSAGDQPDAKAVFDLDARGLLETARVLRDKGELPSGRKVSGRAEFFLGGADSPIDPPPGWEPKSLSAKLAAGAQFVQTQFCMDADVVRRYMARLAECGIADKLYFLIGIAPLRSAKSALWMKEKLFGTIIPDALVARMEAASDPVTEGRAICVDLIGELAGIPNIAGVHIMAPNNDAAVPEVIREARDSVKRLNPSSSGTSAPRSRLRVTETSARTAQTNPAPASPTPARINTTRLWRLPSGQAASSTGGCARCCTNCTTTGPSQPSTARKPFTAQYVRTAHRHQRVHRAREHRPRHRLVVRQHETRNTIRSVSASATNALRVASPGSVKLVGSMLPFVASRISARGVERCADAVRSASALSSSGDVGLSDNDRRSARIDLLAASADHCNVSRPGRGIGDRNQPAPR